ADAAPRGAHANSRLDRVALRRTLLCPRLCAPSSLSRNLDAQSFRAQWEGPGSNHGRSQAWSDLRLRGRITRPIRRVAQEGRTMAIHVARRICANLDARARLSAERLFYTTRDVAGSPGRIL